MTSSGWTRQLRCEYRQTTVQEPWGRYSSLLVSRSRPVNFPWSRSRSASRFSTRFSSALRSAVRHANVMPQVRNLYICQHLDGRVPSTLTEDESGSPRQRSIHRSEAAAVRAGGHGSRTCGGKSVSPPRVLLCGEPRDEDARDNPASMASDTHAAVKRVDGCRREEIARSCGRCSPRRPPRRAGTSW